MEKHFAAGNTATSKFVLRKPTITTICSWRWVFLGEGRSTDVYVWVGAIYSGDKFRSPFSLLALVKSFVFGLFRLDPLHRGWVSWVSGFLPGITKNETARDGFCSSMRTYLQWRWNCLAGICSLCWL